MNATLFSMRSAYRGQLGSVLPGNGLHKGSPQWWKTIIPYPGTWLEHKLGYFLGRPRIRVIIVYTDSQRLQPHGSLYATTSTTRASRLQVWKANISKFSISKTTRCLISFKKISGWKMLYREDPYLKSLWICLPKTLRCRHTDFMLKTQNSFIRDRLITRNTKTCRVWILSDRPKGITRRRACDLVWLNTENFTRSWHLKDCQIGNPFFPPSHVFIYWFV